MRTQEEQGALGEHLVREGLNDLNSEYRAIHDLVISTQDGRTTQIDHVLVSPFGVTASRPPGSPQPETGRVFLSP